MLACCRPQGDVDFALATPSTPNLKEKRLVARLPLLVTPGRPAYLHGHLGVATSATKRERQGEGGDARFEPPGYLTNTATNTTRYGHASCHNFISDGWYLNLSNAGAEEIATLISKIFLNGMLLGAPFQRHYLGTNKALEGKGRSLWCRRQGFVIFKYHLYMWDPRERQKGGIRHSRYRSCKGANVRGVREHQLQPSAITSSHRL